MAVYFMMIGTLVFDWVFEDPSDERAVEVGIEMGVE